MARLPDLSWMKNVQYVVWYGGCVQAPLHEASERQVNGNIRDTLSFEEKFTYSTLCMCTVCVYALYAAEKKCLLDCLLTLTVIFLHETKA